MERFLKYFDEPISRAELNVILGKKQATSVISFMVTHEWVICETPKFRLTTMGRLVWKEYTDGRR